MSRMVSFFVLLAIIVVCSVLFYRVMSGFLLPLFLAALLAVIFRPIHHWFLIRCKERRYLAAGLTTTAVLLIVLVPLALITGVAILELRQAVTGGFDVHDIDRRIERLRRACQLDNPLQQQLIAIQESLSSINLDIDNLDIDPFDRQQQAVSSLLDVGGAIQEIEAVISDELELSRDEEDAGRERRFKRVIMDLPKSQVSSDDAAVQQRPATDEPTIPDMARTDFSQAVQALSSELAATLPPDSESLEEQLAQLQVLRGKFTAFRTALLGGQLKSQLVDLVYSDVTSIQWWKDNALKTLSEENLQRWLLSITGATAGRLVAAAFAFAVMILALYYFLAEGSTMISTLMRLSPLDDRYENELIMEFDKVSRAVVLATLLSAVAQGLLGGIGYGLAGMPSVFLLTMLTMVLALVPFVGAAAVWVPCSLWLMFIADGKMVAGVLLAVYGFAIISMADNVIKPLILHGQSRLHPLLALLSVLGGVKTLGPIGILVGPMIVAFLQALLDILQKELLDMDRRSTKS